MGSAASPGLRRATVIEPPRHLVPLQTRQLWAYRDLFWFLVRRDIKVRWAQTRVGSAWLLLQPLAMLGVYTFAFSRIVDTHLDVPYPLFAIAGLTAWQFTSRSIQIGSDSLVNELTVIKQTACPRILFPVAAVVSGGIDFVVALALYFVLGAAYSEVPTWRALFVLPLLLLASILSLGFALLFAPANARYRDVGRLLPFAIQLWFFVSPVAYPLPRTGGALNVVESVNPLVGILSGFRWALLGARLEARSLVLAALVAVIAVVAGTATFNRAQQTIADDL